jgi:hypothetical protein
MRALALAFFVIAAAAALASVAVLADEFHEPPPYWRSRSLYNRRHEAMKRAIERARASRAEWARLQNFPDAAALERHMAANGGVGVGASQCRTCSVAVEALFEFFVSNPGQRVTIALLNATCDKMFANSTSDATLCKMAADALDHILYTALYGLGVESGWNMSATVCADFLKLCTVPCCDAATPHRAEQRRLVFGGPVAIAPVTNMTVTWVTLLPTTGDFVEYSVLRSGAFGPATRRAAAPQTTTKYGGWVGSLHSATMTGLPAGATVRYRVGSTQGGTTDWAVFKTLRLDAGTKSALRVIAIADQGIFNSSDTIARMRARVQRGDIDFMVHAGDIGYYDGFESVWDEYFRMLEPITSRIPIAYTIGNHEAVLNDGGDYRARAGQYMPPANHGAPADALYYTLHVGPLTIIGLNSETTIDTADIDAAQVQWLAPRLAEADTVPGGFTFVMNHRPLYCTFGKGDCDTMAAVLRAQAEDVFKRGNVDLHFSGHMHSYQRIWPVYQSSVQTTNLTCPDAPMYVVNGAAGNREPTSRVRSQAPWVAYTYDTGFGYQVLRFQQRVMGDGKAHMAVDSNFYSGFDDRVLDAFTLVSKRT